jgi:hypothetical protein
MENLFLDTCYLGFCSEVIIKILVLTYFVIIITLFLGPLIELSLISSYRLYPLWLSFLSFLKTVLIRIGGGAGISSANPNPDDKGWLRRLIIGLGLVTVVGGVGLITKNFGGVGPIIDHFWSVKSIDLTSSTFNPPRFAHEVITPSDIYTHSDTQKDILFDTILEPVGSRPIVVNGKVYHTTVYDNFITVDGKRFTVHTIRKVLDQYCLSQDPDQTDAICAAIGTTPEAFEAKFEPILNRYVHHACTSRLYHSYEKVLFAENKIK